jgi:hypothetical protein
MRTDLEMLREVVAITGLNEVNKRNHHLAAEVTSRLIATDPALKPFAPSGKEPEPTALIRNRLPDPKDAPLRSYHEYGQ